MVHSMALTAGMMLSKLPLRDGNRFHRGGAQANPRLSKLPLRDGNRAMECRDNLCDQLSKLPLRDGNLAPTSAMLLRINSFETSFEGWKQRAGGPHQDGFDLSKLPLRDGNPKIFSAAMQSTPPFETSLEGWKPDFRLGTDQPQPDFRNFL